jgi:hypothetical protein
VELPVAVVLRLDDAEQRHPRSEPGALVASVAADLSGIGCSSSTAGRCAQPD